MTSSDSASNNDAEPVESSAVAATRSNQQKVSLNQRRRARRLTLQALYQWLLAEGEPREIARQFQEETEGKVDWAFFNEVFLDIPPNRELLDEKLNPLLDREQGRLDPIEQALLYQGCYELAFRVDVPYRVVINECVELAKQFGATDGHKYINGVLDKLVPVLRSLEYSAKS
jgi:N utilization substance protein B